jgi:hypothetical protein
MTLYATQDRDVTKMTTMVGGKMCCCWSLRHKTAALMCNAQGYR